MTATRTCIACYRGRGPHSLADPVCKQHDPKVWATAKALSGHEALRFDNWLDG